MEEVSSGYEFADRILQDERERKTEGDWRQIWMKSLTL